MAEPLSGEPAIERTVTLEQLLGDEALLDGLLARFGRRYPEPEPIGVATQWSKLLLYVAFQALLPPLAEGQALAASDLGGAEIGLADSLPQKFTLRAEAGREALADEAALAALFGSFLLPAARRLQQAGLPAKTFWSNAGNYIEYALQQQAEAGSEGARRLSERLLERETLPWLAVRNPVHRPIVYLAEGDRMVRWRRLCCLRDRLPEMPLCSVCPKLRQRSARSPRRAQALFE